jgi:hypothetical protein
MDDRDRLAWRFEAHRPHLRAPRPVRLSLRGGRRHPGALRGGAQAGQPGPPRVNGAAGPVVAAQGRPLSVMAFTVARGRIVEIDILAAPGRLRRLDLAAPHG